MNGGSDIEIDAILGDEPGSDPDRRAQLVARLSAALESRNPLPPVDVMQIAAYLDQGMTEDEKLDLYKRLSASAANYADLESAIDLLETVQNSPQRPSVVVMASARGILVPEPVQRKPIWQRLSAPRARLALGFAFAASVGLLIWTPFAEFGATNSVSVPQIRTPGRADDMSHQALLGESLSAIGIGVPASPAPASSLWGAVAVSKGGNIYGVAQDVSTREAAVETAVANCAARHGSDCTVMASGQGQCFGVAGEIEGIPAAASADSIAAAQRIALATCNSARNEIIPCTMLTSFCSKK
jgi:hypothetical protein